VTAHWMLAVLAACSAPQPRPLTSVAASRPRPPQPFVFRFENVEMGHANLGACIDSYDDRTWVIQLPSSGDDCHTGSRMDDDWLELSIPRCHGDTCRLPEPGETFETQVSITKYLEHDEVGVPVRARFSVLRRDGKNLIARLDYLGHVHEDQRMYSVEFGGEIVIEIDDNLEERIERAHWRDDEN
jgi:hypothetical protein